MSEFGSASADGRTNGSKSRDRAADVDDTVPVYERVRHHVPEIEWPALEAQIERINRLKQERRAIVLAHNYMTPDIFHGVSDYTGDSLGLARAAADTDADVIVLAGVHFMAETAKLLNPDKLVLIPDLEAGCSLASSITAADVSALRAEHPGVPVVTYVNTTAAVKAASDICCTSANAVEIVESLGTDEVIFIPDQYLAAYVAGKTDVTVIPWRGRCEVHEQFEPSDFEPYRKQYPDLQIVAHPECSPAVLQAADFVGSTSGMIRHVADSKPEHVMLVTECSMSDNVAVEYPDVNFVRPCNMCPHMKRITLANIAESLANLQFPVEIDPRIAEPARASVERMLAVGKQVRR
jgi:quinolinate synthase